MNFIKHLNQKTAKEYEYVEDQKDLRIPVQSEDAFTSGVQFKAKYIGTQEISRPSTRVEIVTAMRRIRYEFKYRNIKKRKVYLEVSVNGIRVSLRKKQKKAIPDISRDDCSLFIMHYPINRVFYVSHDSQDLKIFSFIARSDDGSFKCSVFKAIRKSVAMNTVRTIGQAFEVCHKWNNGKDSGDATEKNELKEEKQKSSSHPLVRKSHSDTENDGETDIDELGETDIDDVKSPLHDIPMAATKSTVVTDIDTAKEPRPASILPVIPQLDLASNGGANSGKFTASNLKQVQLLYHQQLMHQIHETEVMRSELTLVKEQLRAESTSRADAQARVHRLLAQNRELIVTIQKLMGQLQEKHCKENGEPVDESWILDTALTSSRSATMTTDIHSTVPSTASRGENTSLIDFESSVFDNVYQFANFDANRVPPPIQSNGDAGSSSHGNTASNPRAPVQPKSAVSSNNHVKTAKVAYSPLKSLYSSESEDISDSSWRDDSQDEDALPLNLGVVAANAAPFGGDAMENFTQTMLQSSFPSDGRTKRSTQID